MATRPSPVTERDIEYPTGDGKPMAETDVHRDLMLDLIETLKIYYAAHPDVYVSGNLLLFYERGDKRKHVAPDVLVVRGVPKLPRRDHYLTWLEGKGPDLVVELTSKSTRREDQVKKLALYRDVLKVPEYFLFDPYQEYLKPSLQGYRLVEGQYVAIEPVEGRLPSAVLGLYLERDGTELRLYNPVTGRWLLTPREATAEAVRQAEAERRRAEAERAEREAAQAEIERLRREIDRLRRPDTP
jgi:Uma2 family endonuclease